MRFTRFLAGAALSVALLGSCAPTTLNLPDLPTLAAPASTDLTDRPAGSPDVVIFAVSGRCAIPCLGAPDANVETLSRRGSIDLVREALEARGLRVAVYTYAAHPAARYVSTTTGREERGFQQLQADFATVEADLVRGRRDPARIILLAHSHGVTWARNLVRLNPASTFDVTIDLDGVCSLWERDNAPLLRRIQRAPGGSPWPIDLVPSCRPIRVGRAFVHLKDIALDNVTYDLEVQSGGVLPPRAGDDGPVEGNYYRDGIRNRRVDGSTRGVQTLVSAGENHSTVSYGGSRAMRWVVARLLELPIFTRPLDTPSP
ncbi:hypothetical protein [Deinococcus pimensis]|uniref:hypothetical protein n=1 Tax=Deinococcus pimensis TaxID=309888 RepID=UPI0004AEDF21|nr:hypothetical protein [Deinococcus pimensis]